MTGKRGQLGWSRRLPQPLKIPSVMTLRTLADIRELIRDLPAEARERDTWQHVAYWLDQAARGGKLDDVVIALRMVLQPENVPCVQQ